MCIVHAVGARMDGHTPREILRGALGFAGIMVGMLAAFLIHSIYTLAPFVWEPARRRDPSGVPRVLEGARWGPVASLAHATPPHREPAPELGRHGLAIAAGLAVTRYATERRRNSPTGPALE